MCGICGQILFEKSREIDPVKLRAMAKTLAHRGPDDLGIYVKKNVGLGHTRLAVIDIEGGKQPMRNHDGSHVLVFNGEIYNFKELRTELEGKGYKFRTESDTEVLLKLYADRGEDCVNDLAGMFAFAIYDLREDKIFLARDRFGQKPLYYAMAKNAFVFASELKALMKHDALEKKLSKQALQSYFAFRYTEDGDTIFEGVSKLEPATTLTYKAKKITTKKYWSIPTKGTMRLSSGETYERLDALLRKAVRARMVADVPLGAFLSGGVDSSLVVALMAEQSAEKINTFSIGFEDADYNELRHAKKVAKLFGTNHNEFTVRADAVKDLEKIVFYLDEPFADSSALPTYYLAAMTRRHVTVALNGDGGDEVFGGYERYYGMYTLPFYRSIVPRFLRAKVLKPFFDLLFREPRRWGPMRMLKWLNDMSLLQQEPYLAHMAMRGQHYLTDLLHDEHKFLTPPPSRLASLANRNAGLHTVKQYSVVDLESYLPDDLLVKIDRMTMASSLEARSPFLDHHLVEFVMGLRPELVYRTDFLKMKENPKRLLKQYAAKYLPTSILRRRKMGFGVPISRWFRTDLKDYLREVFEHSLLAQDGIFRKEAMLRILAHHLRRSADNSELLWAILVFELWYKNFMKSG